MIIQAIGVLAALCFAVSGVQLAYGVVRQGSAQDFDLKGILLVLGGSVGTFVFLVGTSVYNQITLEMLVNAGSWFTILFYKLKGSK